MGTLSSSRVSSCLLLCEWLGVMGADRPTDGEAWDLVEEINELSRGELEVIEEHEKEFDRLVSCVVFPSPL